MKRLILTAIAVLFPTLAAWTQTGTSVPASPTPAVAPHPQAASTSAHRQRRQKHHTHQQQHHHTGVNAMR